MKNGVVVSPCFRGFVCNMDVVGQHVSCGRNGQQRWGVERFGGRGVKRSSNCEDRRVSRVILCFLTLQVIAQDSGM